MFQAFDSPDHGATQSSEWMGLLARAPMDALEAGLAEHATAHTQWLRPPETGLLMVQGRAGGTGERFNLGEVTITRCALRLSDQSAVSSSPVGVAYVMGRTHRRARLAALADALLQDPVHRPRLDVQLLQPLRAAASLQREQRAAEVAATKVEFFTVAREAGAPDDEEGAE